MFNSRRLIIAASAMALLAGCATPNPYENQGQGSTGLSKTATYGGLGALAGAVAGAAIDHNNRGKGALIGAAVAGLGASSPTTVHDIACVAKSFPGFAGIMQGFGASVAEVAGEDA